MEDEILAKPDTTLEQAKQLVLKLYGMEVLRINELNGYVDKNFYVLVSDKHTNPHVAKISAKGYVLKVHNTTDSLKTHVEAEHAAERLCHASGIRCPLPVPDLEGRDYSKQILIEEDANHNGQNTKDCKEHIVRLLVFIPGRTIGNVSCQPSLLCDCGKLIARVRDAMKGFSHPSVRRETFKWNVISVPKLKEILHVVEDEKQRKIVSEVIDDFSATVIPKLKYCPKGVIHGDFNEQNIIVEPTEATVGLPESDRDYQLAGIIDFGHVGEAYFIFELAICVMYLMVSSNIIDPLLVGGHVLAGYLTRHSLNDTEWDVLKTCVAGRFCQSLVIGAHTYSLDPGNEYILVTAANGWNQLARLWATPKEELYTSWKRIIDSYNGDCNEV